MSESVHDRIRQRLADLGLSPEAAAKKANLSRDYLRKMFSREGMSPRGSTLEALAGALQVSPAWLLSGEEPASPQKRPGELRPAPVEAPDRNRMPNDVPVHGTAAASHLRGAFQLEPGIVDWVRRPPALTGAGNAYALYIEGSSMEPRYQAGDLIFVHPNRPPKAGDTVIVQVEVADNEVEASIGYLRRRTAEHVVLGKLNPEAEVQLPRATVKAIHRVLTINELFGV